MIEGFKINALKLKRAVKVSVYLPDEYNYSKERYPLLLCLDGQDLFNFILEDTLKINLPDIIAKNDKKMIAIGIQSPKIPEWRISELNPYYNGDVEIVDKSLAVIYENYIINELLPLLLSKYRIKSTSILGFHEGAILALDMLYKAKAIDKCYMLSPKLENCSIVNLNEEIKRNYQEEKFVHMFLGGKTCEISEMNRFMAIYTNLDSLKCPNVELTFDDKEDNNYEDIKKQIVNIIKKY